jgi:flagella basal body P-ring formation protein FlgA
MKRVLSLLAITFPMFALAKGEVAVRPYSLIQHGSSILLGEIVDMRDLDLNLRDQLKDLPLASAPAPGEKLEFSSAAISGLLRTALSSLPTSPHLLIPARVVIERSTHIWEQSVVEKELINYWQLLCGDCQLEIDQLTMPPGKYESWTLSPRKELPHGGFSVAAKVEKDGKPYTLWIQGNLIVRRMVPVAKREIFFGERIQAGDFAWRLRDVTFAQDGIPAVEDVEGRRVKASLRADDILYAGMIERDKALHRGDVARVISGESEWQVSISAIAQQDADIGDTVTLKNPKSNKELTGTVVAKDEVEIK